MKSHHIKFDQNTENFLQDYKKSHGVNIQAFVEMAVREKIINVKAELTIKQYANNR